MSLDEFDYLTKLHIKQLASKVRSVLAVSNTTEQTSDENFLQTVIRDYQYYALEDI